ncbi:esterase/lipase family protein [Actinacidiphila paucisporea]|uniref:Alpha/beta hydrolase fold n=1 Tax=Actinacidiphila paucisporea TaxID=310782 RepID=A0A1M7QMN4_9ACTN|nr:alpha/beta fold hydrolase [Actinacidiphila paucisporea]SHN32664.1 alpha/beta hydrolase fold [Actinacidiphila paucisporea]
MSDGSGFPLVYVRGFAGGTPGIDKAVTDPFYGFNEGSTHVRVGSGDEPHFYQFEGPLLRLHTDEGYQILVEGGQMAYLDRNDQVPWNTIWVHRFYDVSADTWGARPQDFSLESAARDLLALIRTLQQKTGAPRVHLVAHSMGGLICRCLLQKIIPDEGGDPRDYVEKLFTYGTPHGGIAFDVGFGTLERLRDALGIEGADIFGPRRMYEYLTPEAQREPGGPPEGWPAREMPAGPRALPLDKVMCVVGTDPSDYDVALGLSADAVGVRSDGLVQIENAYVPGAHRAFVHRSHSGRYGLVNSEEAYQSLRRFLFGDLRVDADLVGHRLPDTDPNVTWQAEVRLAVRGLPVVLHERLAAHWCPLQLSAPGEDGSADGAVRLATTFLSSRLPPPGTDTMRFSLQLRVFSVRQERHRLFAFRDHLEQVRDFDDTLIVDVTPSGGAPSARAAWNSRIAGSVSAYEPSGPSLLDENPAPDTWTARVPLPSAASATPPAAPLLGDEAAIRLTVTPWG